MNHPNQDKNDQLNNIDNINNINNPNTQNMPKNQSINIDQVKKPCRICTDFQKTYSKTTAFIKNNQSNLTFIETLPCPPDSQELGRNTWTFLHTTAAYYSENPSPDDKIQMTNFINLFSKIYPCSHCAHHLQSYIKKHPPTLNDNKELSLWFCDVHNQVNKLLGKPIFDCNLVFERWKHSNRKDCN